MDEFSQGDDSHGDMRTGCVECLATPDRGTGCGDCAARYLCLPSGLGGSALDALDRLIGERRNVERKEELFRAGDSFSHLYVARSAAVITVSDDDFGQSHVVGYFGPGDLFGIDGLATGTHTCTAVTTRPGALCALPFDRLQALASMMPALQRNLVRLFARTMHASFRRAIQLTYPSAEQRLAAFLLEIDKRRQMLGLEATCEVVCMSGIQLASFLGLRPETVSRTLRRLRDAGVVDHDAHCLQVMDWDGLLRFFPGVSEADRAIGDACGHTAGTDSCGAIRTTRRASAA